MQHARGSPQRLHLAWPCLIVSGHITHRLLGLLQAAAGSIGVDCPGWRLWSSHSTPTQTHPRTRMAFIDFRPRREPRFHGCYFDILSCYGASVIAIGRCLISQRCTHRTQHAKPLRDDGTAKIEHHLGLFHRPEHPPDLKRMKCRGNSTHYVETCKCTNICAKTINSHFIFV
ncbi:hypothetical protein TcasGA2_TC004917 [Tribolium castaneum]|uniref:Uncharacterized protein n=1 Tax=Tribolium castaneum TaxID=7070 RepID=D6WCK8_TRICA|nr:hypothetical protein TcasGA2_TC004917 [Tribolium castaneum]